MRTAAQSRGECVYSCLQLSRNQRDYTATFQGLRCVRVRYARASFCRTVNVAASQSTFTPLRSATLARWQDIVERLQISISLAGFCRVRTQWTKLAQCFTFETSDFFSSAGCRSDPFSGRMRYMARSRYNVPREP